MTRLFFIRVFRKAFDGNINMIIGDEITLYENGHQESSDSRATAKWNEGIVSFDFDGKKWNAVK